MNTIKLTIESYRCHGEEKLKRPACLKGLKPAWELPIIGKKCKVYELDGGDLLLHMGELFCKLMSFPDAEDMTLPTSALISKYPDRMSRKSVKGFVYADAWCTIYARNEGYIRIKGLRESLSDIFRLKLGPIYDAVYDGLRSVTHASFTSDSRAAKVQTRQTTAASAKHWWGITSCWKGISIGSNPRLFVLHPLHGKDELYR